MTIHTAYRRLLAALYDVYDNREAANICDLVIEHVTGQRKIDRIMYKDLPVSQKQEDELEAVEAKLISGVPVQYVLGEAWFADMKLYVNDQVLIPRPETEELVSWICTDLERHPNLANITLLDIGTGSGCIAIALKKRLKLVQVTALDVSPNALEVAQRNATEYNANIDLLQLNFLEQSAREKLGTFKIIVSNPPYIREQEAASMAANVLDHEPHRALFVPDNDALIFYQAIAEFGKSHLEKEGAVYMEINEHFGEEVQALFKNNGYVNVQVKKDLQGKDRMVKAIKA
ncbi:peptide chain release factor N(5)-glutamine methyltransferase [Segetibacter sp. 3557_3]|uniref:peptide chain release factor N(5)-glutamine methyltransferase n=1 Tax=Segetibacter sp. 3557_3 TaxID=2547429 RepID=UPI0010590AA0|nr:peptide chain release factor N(5)-glutamine methyltransferase [Segetibacter sp. 3557_3]TDH27740.1 peptide chain release factor N(5)-glutamine methyltransferase [Segetibacter sp. 3557_3]